MHAAHMHTAYMQHACLAYMPHIGPARSILLSFERYHQQGRAARAFFGSRQRRLAGFQTAMAQPCHTVCIGFCCGVVEGVEGA